MDRGLQVLVNPSTSDVVATTSCEALAMGKWIVCAEHPSNQFFKAFQNALIYKDEAEFSQHLAHAMVSTQQNPNTPWPSHPPPKSLVTLRNPPSSLPDVQTTNIDIIHQRGKTSL